MGRRLCQPWTTSNTDRATQHCEVSIVRDAWKPRWTAVPSKYTWCQHQNGLRFSYDGPAQLVELCPGFHKGANPQSSSLIKGTKFGLLSLQGSQVLNQIAGPGLILERRPQAALRESRVC